MRLSAHAEFILRILGLEGAAHTPVGSPMLRGISGGEKKRLTMGELIVGGGRKVLLCDEISTGLDSETTSRITAALRAFAHFRDATVLVALLAPPPETYELFDDVLLLCEGHIVYHGPRQHAAPFLQSLGFTRAPNAADADFLVEALAGGHAATVGDEERGGASGSAALPSAAEIAAAYRASRFGEAQAALLRAGCGACGAEQEGDGSSPPLPAASALLPTQRYALSWFGMLRANAWRELILPRRNAFVYAFRTSQLALAAAISATLFLRVDDTNLTNGTLLAGFLFYSVSSMFFSSFSEMALAIVAIPVYDKQSRALFYDSSSYAIAAAAVSVPVSLLEAALWTGIAYFTVGFAPDGGRWLDMFGVLAFTHYTAGCLFRALAAVGRSLVVASTLGSMSALIFFTLSGFVVARDDIPGWWIGGFWCSPLAYAQMALSVNEFTAPRWQHRAVDAADPRMSLGDAVLRSRDLPVHRFWAWVAFPILLGFALAFTAVSIAALRLLAPSERGGGAVSEAERKKRMEGTLADDGGHDAKPTQRAADGPGAVTEAVPPSAHIALTVQGAAAKPPPSPRPSSALPFVPANMTFRDVTYAVPHKGSPGGELLLLQGVTGTFLPGRLTALIGTSGAGKTTLMDVLAGRKTAGRVEGDIRVNGHAKEQRTFTRVAGYVEQNDVHAPATTVREALLFSAHMRLGGGASRAQRIAFADEVLATVELAPLADAMVGAPGAPGALSVEQRKRLTIGVELAANPSILFADEPTSGLDARSAAVVMRAVRAGADAGRTVVCTIHQPSSAVFASFDDLLLLKTGGECIFCGPLGEGARDMIAFFEGVAPSVPRCPPGMNPATWVLHITSDAAASAARVDFGAAFRDSALSARNAARVAALERSEANPPPLRFASRHARRPATQFRLLLARNFATYWRSPSYNLVRAVMTVVIALFFGTVFWQRGTRRDSLNSVFMLMGAMYAAVIFLGVNNASTVQPVAAAEREVLYRERAAGMYSSLPWAAALQLVEVPYVLAQTAVYTAIVYAMIGFEWSAPKLWWFALFELLTLLTFTMYGQMAVALTPNVQLASVVSSFFYSFFNLFAGFLIPVPRMPWWWRWYAFMNPVQWTLYGLVGSQLGDVFDGCVRATPTAACASPSRFVRDYFGFRHAFLGAVAAILGAFVLCFAAVACLAHARLNFQRR
jgi:ABC-type multidrug transport system ATPase subunit/ABC-type multidrug transport system permease subunit